MFSRWVQLLNVFILRLVMIVCNVLFSGKMVVGFNLGLFNKYLEIDVELELLSVKLSFHSWIRVFQRVLFMLERLGLPETVKPWFRAFYSVKINNFIKSDVNVWWYPIEVKFSFANFKVFINLIDYIKNKFMVIFRGEILNSINSRKSLYIEILHFWY